MTGGTLAKGKALGIAFGTLVVGAGVLVVAGIALANAAPHQTQLKATPLGTKSVLIDGKMTTVNNVGLTISTFPDSLAGMHGSNGGPHPDWVSYSNDNLTVPRNTLVTMTINQYDSGGSLNNPFFASVMGTIGDTATINGATVHHVDPNDIGHTFTLRGIPGNVDPIFVSVPLPANNATDTPVTIGQGSYPHPLVVTFSFLVKGPGVYQWNCEYPCGGSRIGQFGEAMSSYGYMSGTLTVS
jgi:hypothetical protein